MDSLFFLHPLPNIGETAVLTGDEARHAAASRRLQPGDLLWLTNGQGGLAQARIQNLRRKEAVTLRIESKVQTPPPAPQIELASALPKGDRLSVLLDMGTQLGMTAFTPLLCARSVHSPHDTAPDRWRRIMLEACKQSRRTWLPEVNPPATPAKVARRAAEAGRTVWIAHPEPRVGRPTTPAFQAPTEAKPNPPLSDTQTSTYTLFIGPEGGFTDEETSAVVSTGGKCVSLGPAILRIETAAVTLLARLMPAC